MEGVQAAMTSRTGRLGGVGNVVALPQALQYRWTYRNGSKGATEQRTSTGVGEARGRETTTVEEAMTRGKRSGEPSRRAKGSQEEEAAGDGPSSRIYGPS